MTERETKRTNSPLHRFLHKKQQPKRSYPACVFCKMSDGKKEKNGGARILRIHRVPFGENIIRSREFGPRRQKSEMKKEKKSNHTHTHASSSHIHRRIPPCTCDTPRPSQLTPFGTAISCTDHDVVIVHICSHSPLSLRRSIFRRPNSPTVTSNV